MTERIPQSTTKLVVFKAYLASDHTSEATGKTIAITISKNGGAFGNPNAGATNATEISSGWYKVTLDTTDTGTTGPLAVRGAVATIDDVGVLLEVVSATSGGYTNLDAAITSRMATYTQPTGFLSATFPAGTVANTTNITAGTITTVTTVTNQLTAAQIATGVWQDSTAGDFTTASSIGKSLYTSGNVPGAASGIAIVGSNMGTITGALTAAQIATGVWTDTTAGDFTTALSIGKSIMNGVSLGTGLTVNDITTKTGYSLSAAQTFNLTGSITGSLSGSVGSVTGAVGSVTGAVGSVTGAVGSVGAGGITAASFAANAITAAKIDPDVTTELQAGLATSASISTLQTSVDDVPTNAELATALAAADDAVLAQVALVKAKTDSLTFTVANQIDANIQYVNDTQVTGNGSAGTPWGP